MEIADMKYGRREMIELFRYTGASFVALLVDVGVLLVLNKGVGLPVFWSAMLAFTVGIGVIYLLSIRFVFRFRRLGRRRSAEMGWFWFSGLVGLVMTSTAVPWLVEQQALPLLWAKAITVVFVFTACRTEDEAAANAGERSIFP